MPQRRILSLWLPPTKDAPVEDLQALALRCQLFYSPLTAPDPPDGIVIDITGCAHLFPAGEAGLKAHLLTRHSGARAAIANTAAAAWALARYGAADSEDILPLPIAALRLEPVTVTKLRRIGVRRIGELARLPRAGVVAGYGPAPALRLAQALGQAPETIAFITPPPAWRVCEPYVEPIFAPAQLQGALSRLSTQLCTRLSAATRGATTLVARFHRIDRACPEIILGFAAPCRDEAQIAKLLSEKLASHVDPGFGIELISLHATATEPLPPTQRNSLDAEKPDYTQPLNTLLNRLGPHKIWRVAPHDSHIPEYAVRRIPLRTLPPVPWSKPHHPRPLLLLPTPAAITAIAPVPDEPPVQFTWAGASHRVAHATGPERIARDWWCHPQDDTRPETEKIRDYYAVEDTQGARFWLFRAGLHNGEAPARWFLHGFFA
jgi:protein ImuB